MPPAQSMTMTKITPAVKFFLIASIGAFFVQLISDTFLGAHLLDALSLIPYAVVEKFQVWRLFTYMFMHADLFHILFNLLILWMIGSELESQWGSSFFIKYFLACALSGGVFYLVVQMIFKGSGYITPMVGSSGGIYGLLVAYGIIYSERVLLFMMIFPMKAKHFVLILAAIEFISTVFYSQSRVANIAHLGGMLVGFSFLFMHAWLRIKLRQRKTGKKSKFKRSHLRLVVNNEVLNEFDTDEDDQDDEPGTYH